MCQKKKRILPFAYTSSVVFLKLPTEHSLNWEGGAKSMTSRFLDLVRKCREFVLYFLPSLPMVSRTLLAKLFQILNWLVNLSTHKSRKNIIIAIIKSTSAVFQSYYFRHQKPIVYTIISAIYSPTLFTIRGVLVFKYFKTLFSIWKSAVASIFVFFLIGRGHFARTNSLWNVRFAELCHFSGTPLFHHYSQTRVLSVVSFDFSAWF